MKRFVAGGAAALLLAAAVGLSRTQPVASAPAGAPPDLAVQPGPKNPWTHLRINDAPDGFHFAVVSDRTGGHRANVFSRAVKQVNLLQPAFVMSVGDLIEGYTANPDAMGKQWDEFDKFTRRLEMPFFYVPGNHDLSNKAMGDYWAGRYGPAQYHFVYKDVLFLAINTEDPPGTTAVGAAQRDAIKAALAANPGVRWTFVFMHKPIWTAADLTANGWKAVEDLFAGRKYTVFCGHEHRYVKFVRNGMNYYQLATTGGSSRMRGVEYGEFDQVAWVTVGKGDPVVANLALDGVLPDDLRTPDGDEPVAERKRPAVHPVRVTVTADGLPAAGATVNFFKKVPGKDGAADTWGQTADGLTDASGVATLTTYAANDGVPPGEYAVVVVQTGRFVEYSRDPVEGNKLPRRYATPGTTPLRATVTAGAKNDFALDVAK
jgi:hypothetical protein